MPDVCAHDATLALAHLAPTAKASPPPPPGSAFYDGEIADAACRFFPDHCRFAKGDFLGQPFVLGDWQKYIVRRAYGTRTADGGRYYTRIVIWVPRGNGKSDFLGGVAHIEMVGTGQKNPEGYCIATSDDQARITFQRASDMAQMSPTLKPLYEAFVGSLYAPGVDASLRPLSGTVTGKHGLAASFIIGDEVHEWKNDRVFQFVRNSMVKRREHAEWLISTAGLTEGFGWELWNENLKIVEQVYDDPSTLVVIFAADPSDDIYEPAVWAAANPNFGISVDPVYFRREAEKAKTLPRYENDFRRYHLNIWTAQDERWLDIRDWKSCAHDTLADHGPATVKTPERVVHSRKADAWQALRHRPAYLGIDLASTKDMVSLGLVFSPVAADPHWSILLRTWWPQRSYDEAMRDGRVPFDRWVADGYLTLTPGNAADHDAVGRAVLECCEMFAVQQVGVDPWNAHKLAVELSEEGVPVVNVRQSRAQLSSPTKSLERFVINRTLRHYDNPVLDWNISNCAIESDAQGNIMLSKKKAIEKIDGAAATITGLACAIAAVEQQQSYVVHHNIVVI